MNELQRRLTDMLKWFHDLCVENHLRYYAVGGTCLGMVRHKGNIPWDDDIDVAMPRSDYNKLIDLFQEKNNIGYELAVPLREDNYVYSYMKLYDRSTTLVENTRYRTKKGIFLDIFPLDGSGNTLEECRKRWGSISKKQNLIWAKICALNKNRKWYKNAAILLARCVPDKIWNWRRLTRAFIEESSELTFDNCEYVALFAGNWGFRENAKREWFGEPVLYDFEDIQIYGPEKPKLYLTNLYGDYMTPPPPEKQVSHHDFLHLDLNNGYGDNK